jgi:Uma2 family endonuclease
MSAIPVKDVLLSEEEYLRDEEAAVEKHEFVAGVAHAMAGAGYEHNTIAINIVAALHYRLRGQRCQAFASDMKVRVQADEYVHHYYPDAMVVCDRTGLAPGRHWTDKPAVIFEVLSESTRRIDEGEKALLYWKLPSLANYVLVEQDKVQVTVRRRDGGGEVLTGRETLLRLPELGMEIPLGEFYERLAL